MTNKIFKTFFAVLVIAAVAYFTWSGVIKNPDQTKENTEQIDSTNLDLADVTDSIKVQIDTVYVEKPVYRTKYITNSVEKVVYDTVTIVKTQQYQPYTFNVLDSGTGRIATITVTLDSSGFSHTAKFFGRIPKPDTVYQETIKEVEKIIEVEKKFDLDTKKDFRKAKRWLRLEFKQQKSQKNS